MKLYCRSCKFYTTMEYDILKEILEFDDAGDLELYVTKDMFVYLHQNGYFKQLMKIYDNRIWISTRSTSFNLTNMYNGKIILRKTEKTD